MPKWRLCLGNARMNATNKNPDCSLFNSSQSQFGRCFDFIHYRKAESQNNVDFSSSWENSIPSSFQSIKKMNHFTFVSSLWRCFASGICCWRKIRSSYLKWFECDGCRRWCRGSNSFWICYHPFWMRIKKRLNKIESNSNAVQTHYCITWMLYTLVKCLYFDFVKIRTSACFFSQILMKSIVISSKLRQSQNVPFQKLVRQTRKRSQWKANYPMKARQYAVNLKRKKKLQEKHSTFIHINSTVKCVFFFIASEEKNEFVLRLCK